LEVSDADNEEPKEAYKETLVILDMASTLQETPQIKRMVKEYQLCRKKSDQPII